MQFEIPEGADVHIIIGKPTSWAFSPRTCAVGKACAKLDPGVGGEFPALPGEATGARQAPRYGHLLLKGGLGLMLLTGSFAIGQHFGSSPHAPDLARTAAALPRPAPPAEQHTFLDHAQPREAPPPQIAGQVPADFQKQLQQPPTVTPPPGQTDAPGTPGKNPFGLEN
jgi:hypothetical protein